MNRPESCLGGLRRAAVGGISLPSILLGAASGCTCAPPVSEAAPEGVPSHSAASQSQVRHPEPRLDFCSACRGPERSGTLSDPALPEASGLVASSRHSGVYYVHNDSGDTARFFAIDETGATLGQFRLGGTRARDWEDIAIGPCPGGECVYLADFGDNYRVRCDYALFRVPEPHALVPTEQILPFERFPFEYPDGQHNAETLLVHPTTGEIVVVTKVTFGKSAAYRFPLPLTPDVSVVLEKVAELTPPLGTAILTGGDVHPLGRGLLLRSYTDLFFGAMHDNTIVSGLLGPLCAVPAEAEVQGEAVAWTAAGDGWLTVSEGVGSPIYRTRCGAP